MRAINSEWERVESWDEGPFESEVMMGGCPRGLVL